MSSHLSRCVIVAATFVALGSSVHANGVVRLGDPAGVFYADIQSAIDASSDGDVLIVATGVYPKFKIDGKSISVFGAPNVEVFDAAGAVPVTIVNVPAGKHVAIDGLAVDSSNLALLVFSNGGDVWFDSCSFIGANGQSSFNVADPGGDACSVSSSPSVIFSHCILSGGDGGNSGGSLCCSTAGDGGVGLSTATSRVALYDCVLHGGKAGNGGYFEGNGADGCKSGGTLFASGCGFSGGVGGNGTLAHGIDGTGLRNTGSAFVLDCSFVGGGSQSGTIGPITQFAGQARSLSLPTIIDDVNGGNMTLTGVSGDRLFFADALTPTWQLLIAAKGVWGVPLPAKMTRQPLVVVSSSGSLTVPLPKFHLTPPTVGRVIFAQGYVLDSNGSAVLTTPSPMLVLDLDGSPDCNGNGVLDVLDVLDGTVVDVNHNLVPDTCEPTGPWYVDASAPNGGIGTSSSPFNAIAPALIAAKSGDTIIVRDGVYVGAQNRELVAVLPVTIQSEHGPANCTIDCQLQGAAFANVANGLLDGFHFVNGVHPVGGAVSVSGTATIRNCWFDACRATNRGGAIAVFGTLRVVDCAFTNCSASNAGGAIGTDLYAAALRVENSTFIDNSATTTSTSTGGAIEWESDAVMTRCDFEGNHAATGGAVDVRAFHQLSVGHSSFVANYANGGPGGGLNAGSATGITSTLIDDCLFAGNHANGGGGLSFGGGVDSTFALTNSTLVANTATYNGGGIRLASYGTVIANTIAWNNTASGGAQVFLQGVLDISYSDLEGGQGAIGLFGGSVANWGLGNLTLDPLFVDADGADNDPNTFDDNVYRLQTSSPCLDAGDNNALAPDFGDVDGNGNTTEPVPLDLNLKPRRRDLPYAPDVGNGTPPLVDLGCYERQS